MRTLSITVIQKEAIIAHLKGVSKHSPGETEENNIRVLDCAVTVISSYLFVFSQFLSMSLGKFQDNILRFVIMPFFTPSSFPRNMLCSTLRLSHFLCFVSLSILLQCNISVLAEVTTAIPKDVWSQKSRKRFCTPPKKWQDIRSRSRLLAVRTGYKATHTSPAAVATGLRDAGW
jgi:tellurite resistance-related uncharacterized protein